MSNLKNVQLATAVNITTTYAGEFAGEYIAAALLSASTIDDGGLTVKANIAYKEVIKKLATGNLVSPASCDTFFIIWKRRFVLIYRFSSS